MAKPQANPAATKAPTPTPEPVMTAPSPTPTPTPTPAPAPNPAPNPAPTSADVAAATPAPTPTRKRGLYMAGSYADVEIEQDVPMPAVSPIKNTGGRPGYPFHRLTANGNSFFIPKSEKNPNPVKRLAQAISNFNKQVAKDGYYLAVQPAMKGDVEGARVWRWPLTQQSTTA